MDDLTGMDAVTLAAAIRQGQVSPVEAVSAALDRIAAQADLNAFITVTAESALAAARAIVARGAGRAQVSLGAAGIAICGEGEEALVPAVPAATVDITGAGDAMVAGTLHALAAGAGFAEAAAMGALLGALTIETPGTVRADLGPEMLDHHARHRLAPA